MTTIKRDFRLDFLRPFDSGDAAQAFGTLWAISGSSSAPTAGCGG